MLFKTVPISENFVSQYANGSKKDMLTEAAKVLFNNSKTIITVRLPQANDEKITNLQNSAPKTVINNTLPQEEKKNITNENKPEKAVKPKPKISDAETNTEASDNIRFESDQEKMVLELFDGKYIE